MKINSKTAVIIVMLGVVSVSSSSLLVRASTAPPLTLAFYRMAFAALLLLPVILLKKRDELKKIKKSQLIWSMLSGVSVAFHFWLYFMAVHQTTLSAATLLANLEVLFVAGIMFFGFHEKLAKWNIAGIIITLMGSMILCLGDGLTGGSIIGDLLALGAGLCCAFYTSIGRRTRSGEDALSTTTYTFLVYGTAAATLGIVALFTRTPIIRYENMPLNALIGLGLTVFCTLLGHSVFSWGLKYIKAAIISTMKLAEPIFAAVCGIFLFTEIPSVLTIVGGIIILVGVFLTNMEKKQAQ